MANVEWLFIDRASPRTVSAGDRVSAEAGALPIYEVVEISGDRAWVREEDTHRDAVMPLHLLRWRMVQHSDADVGRH